MGLGAGFWCLVCLRTRLTGNCAAAEFDTGPAAAAASITRFFRPGGSAAGQAAGQAAARAAEDAPGPVSSARSGLWERLGRLHGGASGGSGDGREAAEPATPGTSAVAGQGGDERGCAEEGGLPAAKRQRLQDKGGRAAGASHGQTDGTAGNTTAAASAPAPAAGNGQADSQLPLASLADWVAAPPSLAAGAPGGELSGAAAPKPGSLPCAEGSAEVRARGGGYPYPRGGGHPGGPGHCETSGRGDAGWAGEALAGVDVAEQRRILRDIELQRTRAAPGRGPPGGGGRVQGARRVGARGAAHGGGARAGQLKLTDMPRVQREGG
jgi:hypothetical protein